MSFKDDWLPCTQLTLQGNLTIEGFAQKIWHAKPSVCEIHLHASSGMARIDWHQASVLVSPAVIQHATLDNTKSYERQGKVHTTETVGGLETPTDKPLEAPVVAEPTTRADEILAEFDDKQAPFRRRGRKPKAD